MWWRISRCRVPRRSFLNRAFILTIGRSGIAGCVKARWGSDGLVILLDSPGAVRIFPDGARSSGQQRIRAGDRSSPKTRAVAHVASLP